MLQVKQTLLKDNLPPLKEQEMSYPPQPPQKQTNQKKRVRSIMAKKWTPSLSGIHTKPAQRIMFVQLSAFCIQHGNDDTANYLTAEGQHKQNAPNWDFDQCFFI